MTGYEIATLLNAAKIQLEELTTFIEVITAISNVSDIIKERTFQIASGRDINSEAANMHAELSTAVAIVTKQSPRALFNDMGKLQKILAELDFPHSPIGTIVSDLHVSLNELQTLYDVFIAKQSASTLTPLVFSANIFSSKFQDFVKYLSASSYREHIEIANFETASLFFPNALGLEELIQRLQALKEIYTESCQVLNISESDYPLQILKLETGSWYVELAGYPKAIDLMLEGIRAAAKQLFQRYTRAGKLEAMPTRVENLESLLELQKRMKESGLDTAEMGDQLAKSGAILAKQLMTLVANEASVTINDDVIIIEGHNGKSLISGPSRKLIANTSTFPQRIEPYFDANDAPKLEEK